MGKLNIQGKKVLRFCSRLLAVVLVGIGLLLLVYCVVLNLSQQRVSDKTNTVVSEVLDSTPKQSKKDYDILVGRLEEIFKNKDIIGYIRYENCNISYPIVQGSDNVYYLSHDVNKIYSGYGSIFLDCNNNPSLNDDTTLIYGHHMRNGSMFGNLQSRAELGDTFEIYTREGKYSYEVVSRGSYEEKESSLFGSKDVTADVISEKIGYTIDGNGSTSSLKFVTLLTCDHGIDKADYRYCVTGVLQEREKKK